MSKCLAVLWIPTIDHKPIQFDKPLNNGEIKADISDIVGTSLYVKLKIEGNDIIIYTCNTRDEKDFSPFLTLEYKDFSHNGMVTYSFEPKYLEEGDSGFGFDKNHFPPVIYHMIKSFYHSHDFHEDEADSSFKAFVTDQDVEIHDIDNLAIQHYILNYEKIISIIVKNVKEFIRYTIDISKKDSRKAINSFDAFLKMYVMALGYDSYIHSLYHSIYNKKYKISNTDKVARRCAFNIENYIRYLKVIYNFYDTKIRHDTAVANLNETVKAAVSSTKWAIAGIIFSIIFGIGSISYSIKLSNNSSMELHKTQKTIENTISESTRRNEQALDSY